MGDKVTGSLGTHLIGMAPVGGHVIQDPRQRAGDFQDHGGRQRLRVQAVRHDKGDYACLRQARAQVRVVPSFSCSTLTPTSSLLRPAPISITAIPRSPTTASFDSKHSSKNDLRGLPPCFRCCPCHVPPYNRPHALPPRPFSHIFISKVAFYTSYTSYTSYKSCPSSRSLSPSSHFLHILKSQQKLVSSSLGLL